MDIKTKKDFIYFLIDCNILKFGDFITKSKRKTPYFINIGHFQNGEQFNKLGKFYAEFILKSNIDCDAYFGPAYKGIPLVLACCSFLESQYGINKPFFYNRKEAKDHGEKGNFIGYTPKPKEKISIIEDVLTAGTAIRETLPIIKSKCDIICEDMFVLVDRCEYGKNNEKASRELKEEFGINVHSLININDIFKYLKSNEKFKEETKSMQQYIENHCIL